MSLAFPGLPEELQALHGAERGLRPEAWDCPEPCLPALQGPGVHSEGRPAALPLLSTVVFFFLLETESRSSGEDVPPQAEGYRV